MMYHQGLVNDSSAMKMKRKGFDLDEVSADFSDFSLSSLARKIRRLDAELAPIIEEEEPDIPVVFDQPSPEGLGCNTRRGVVIEELPDGLENEERAIVLFNPVNAPLVHSPSNFSLSVSPQLMSGFMNQVLSSKPSNSWGASVAEKTEQEENCGAGNECLAVVPWVPSQFPLATPNEAAPQTDVSDMMEAEDMDVEDFVGGFDQTSGMNASEGLHQWKQQHCMIPLPPQNTSTPIVWFR